VRGFQHVSRRYRLAMKLQGVYQKTSSFRYRRRDEQTPCNTGVFHGGVKGFDAAGKSEPGLSPLAIFQAHGRLKNSASDQAAENADFLKGDES
jgi:hypothetical protein